MPPRSGGRDDRQPAGGPCPPSPNPRRWSTHPDPADRTVGATRAAFLSVFQHAPRGVDLHDLRPLRGRPFGPILDPDAYPGAPNNRTEKIKERGTRG